MSGRGRRQEARDLVRRTRQLSPEQAGSIRSVLLGNALVSVGLEIALLATCARAARRVLRVRRLGAPAMVRTALAPPVVTPACVSGTYWVCSRALLMRWVRRAVVREEASEHRQERPAAS